MQSVTTLHPEQEPTVTVTIGNTLQAPFMIDTGATYSSIGKEGSQLPLTCKAIQTMGFSGKIQTLRFTEPQELSLDGVTIQAPLLYSPGAPVNLLGRDALCKLGAQIQCEATGIWVTFPKSISTQFLLLHEPPSTARNVRMVYWLEMSDPANSELWHRYAEWKPWLQYMRPDCTEVEAPLYCTIKNDDGGRDQKYAQLWEDMEQGQVMDIKTMEIISGPQGVAAIIKLPDRIANWYQLEGTAPHVTLMVTKGLEREEVEPMIGQAKEVQEWKPTTNPSLHKSPDGKFVRISVTAVDTAVATSVCICTNTDRSGLQMAVKAAKDQDNEEILKTIPEELWTKHPTDVGLVKSADLAQIKVKENARLPYQKQYPLSVQAREGIRPTIHGLVEAGVLISTRSQCNTPIFPVRKPDSEKWRLVHDLRAINQIVIPETPVVPDPHTLLSNIPEGTKWYTVIDLCSAFFSVPLHPDSQHLFAFTYEGQQYTYTRLPQGYCESPSIFNQVLAQDLSALECRSTILQYVDDLLICSASKEQCQHDSLKVLRMLAENGHKVSKEKLQFCRQKVEYLGRVLEGESRTIAPKHVEAIRKAPQPTTVRQMLAFLGMAGFSRPWICEFALRVQPLRDMIKAADQSQPNAPLVWTPEALATLADIKMALMTAPALANPDYSKPFHLYVSERKGYASAVLTQQQQGMGKQAISYYSTALDNVEKGMPPCYRSLAAAAFAYQKASSITMGHPVTLYTTHALHALLTSQTFVITNSRRTGYDSILSAPELTIERCTTVNPADKLVTPIDGVPHECVAVSEIFLKARSDLENCPIDNAKHTYFVDGSCYRTNTGNKAGLAVVEARRNPATFEVVMSVPLPQPCSAQLAELRALTAACNLGRNESCNIYTDSAYAHGVCHVFGPIWAQRGFQRADDPRGGDFRFTRFLQQG